MVFVALAGMGGTPVKSSAGNAIKLPPPATEFKAPPSAPAKKRKRMVSRVKLLGVSEFALTCLPRVTSVTPSNSRSLAETTVLRQGYYQYSEGEACDAQPNDRSYRCRLVVEPMDKCRTGSIPAAVRPVRQLQHARHEHAWPRYVEHAWHEHERHAGHGQ